MFTQYQLVTMNREEAVAVSEELGLGGPEELVSQIHGADLLVTSHGDMECLVGDKHARIAFSKEQVADSVGAGDAAAVAFAVHGDTSMQDRLALARDAALQHCSLREKQGVSHGEWL